MIFQCFQDILGIENLAFCGNADGNLAFGCKCEDSTNNTYACVRTLTVQENSLFCTFSDEQDFEESYDLLSDPFQLHNIIRDFEPLRRNYFHQQLQTLLKCEGYECNQTNDILDKK